MASPTTMHGDEVVIVATDIVSSSTLWEEHGATFQRALDLHDRLLMESLGLTGGYAMRSEGDGLRALFSRAADALRFCLEAQRRLRDAQWPAPLTSRLAVRMGIHSAGVPIERDPVGGRLDLRGLDVLRAEHLADIAHGGQILLSEAAALRLRAATGDRERLRPLGRWLLPALNEAMVVFEAIGTGASPPRRLRATPIPLTNLPPAAEPLVGRQDALAGIARQLEQGARVVALTGPPGVGKSALAETVARAALGLEGEPTPIATRAAAWRVELEDQDSADALARQAATALGLDSDDAHAVARVGETLGGLIAPLLVLDNADRLPSAAWAPLAVWLAAAPDLAVIVTCRAPPPARCDAVMPIQPLALPDSAGAAALSASPAGALFLAHARAARPGLQLTDAAICWSIHEVLRWTGGLPLAIQLSASRLRVLSPGQLSARLGQQALELVSERPSRPHEAPRSLLAVMERATATLSPNERKAFSWLSAFHGSFGDAAGEALVQAALGAPSPAVLPALERAGLLQRSPDGRRRRLIPPIASFAHHLLEPDAPAARTAHARIFARLGRQHRRQTSTGAPPQDPVVSADDLDNLVEATLWAASQGEGATAFLARRAASEILCQRGPLEQVIVLNRTVRKLPGLNARDQAELDWAEGQALTLTRTPRDGLPLLERALRVDHGDSELRARILRTVASVLGEEGRILEGLQLVEQALALDLEGARPAAIGQDRTVKAELLLLLGETTLAEAELRLALAELGPLAPHVGALAMGCLAQVRRAAGANGEALELLTQAIETARGLGDHRARATLTGRLGVCLQAAGRPEEAALQLRRAIAQRRQIGLRREVIEAQIALGAVLTELGGVVEGREVLEDAVGAATALGDTADEAAAASGLAALEARAGDLVTSNAWARRARTVLARKAPPSRFNLNPAHGK